MNSLNVKKGDTVVVISGKDKGKQGKILVSYPDKNRVVVQDCAMAVRHVKPRRQGEAGGIVKAEAALYASKVMPVCPSCNKPTRVGFQVAEDGTKVRVCKHCGETF